MAEYDMCVDMETLGEARAELQLIEGNLLDSVNSMINAINQADGFLIGNQFEKARSYTGRCVEITKRTIGNISHAADYLDELMELLNEYSKCTYKGVK